MLFLAIALCPAVLFSQDFSSENLTDEQENAAVQTIRIWIDEMIKGENLDKAMAVSDIPFVFDGKRIVNSTAELEKLFLGIFNKKGRRKVPNYEVRLIGHKYEIVDKSIPLNFLKAMVLIGDGHDREDIVVCVAIKENSFKVVGFND